MAASLGTNAVLKLTSGSLRDISTYVDTTGIAKDVEAADVTTLGATAHVYIPGLSDATIPFEGPYDETMDGYLAVVERTVTTWEFYPNLTTTGKVKYSGSCIVTKYEIKSGVDGANKMTCELQMTGAITRAVV